jgi:NIMA (never in mitosis gene a)-related kinase
MGVILYELCALKQPFSGDDRNQVMMTIIYKEPDPLPKVFSPEMNDLVSQLLTKNHNDRPDVPTIFKMPFVKGMLKKLEKGKLA